MTNREYMREYMRKYRKANRERLREYRRQWLDRERVEQEQDEQANR